ncbi:hypothetical protein YC2023_026718 [Brassica napus]
MDGRFCESNGVTMVVQEQEIDESEDVEEHFYGENDNESELSSDDGKEIRERSFDYSHGFVY